MTKKMIIKDCLYSLEVGLNTNGKHFIKAIVVSSKKKYSDTTFSGFASVKEAIRYFKWYYSDETAKKETKYDTLLASVGLAG